MEAAKKNYPKEYQEMLELVSEYKENMPDFLEYV